MKACRITRPPLKDFVVRFPQREFHIRNRLESIGHEVIQYEIRPGNIRNMYMAYGVGALQSIVRFRKVKADVIIADNIESAAAAVILRLLYRVPVVFDFIDDYSLIAKYDNFCMRYHLIRYLERRLPRWADLVIVVDEHKGLFCKKIGVAPEQTVLIPQGADMERFRPDVPPAEGVANHHFRDANIVFYAGKLNKYYRLGIVIDAIPYVLERFPNSMFVFVGHGDNMDELKERCEMLNIGHAAIFTGYLPAKEIPSLIARSDVCVFPLPDSSALAIFEYMACAKPVVIPDYRTEKMGISGELLPDDCIVKAPNSPQGIAGNIVRLLEDEQLRLEIGKKARRCVETNYRWDVLASRYEAALKAVVVTAE